MSPKKWSNRFEKGLSPLALDFTQSVSFDKKLYYYDVLGSIAHVNGLARAGLLSTREKSRLMAALKKILKDVDSGRVEFREDLEDVHLNIEALLIKHLGPLGGKIHTGRSRNDQVTLDLRLYCRDRLEELHSSLLHLEKSALTLAKKNLDIMMPGYTHLQPAQPILFSHYLLAYVEMWERDRSRTLECHRRMNVCPLGSGALAGTSYPIDREKVAGELGFIDVTHNSLDAVSDRDFVIESGSVASLLMMHLSRLAEELILWSSKEYSFIDLPEEFCTGSSMMPQKINPDVLELIRGKTGRVYGHLFSLLTLMKSLPLAYNKDMQEDKEAVFDLLDTVIDCVDMMAELFPKMKPNRERMREALQDSFLLATDIADWLVRRGVDFRSSHGIVSQLVRYAEEHGKELTELSLVEFRKFSKKFDLGVLKILKPEASIALRNKTGGTAPEAVKKEIKRLEKRLASFSLR
ncbi:MAG: argininosuccinate lyase [Deltaproteobacteria bacterium]|nr:argininosuccinate lyase [Deltaproteobacteria bacterium]